MIPATQHPLSTSSDDSIDPAAEADHHDTPSASPPAVQLVQLAQDKTPTLTSTQAAALDGGAGGYFTARNHTTVSNVGASTSTSSSASSPNEPPTATTPGPTNTRRSRLPSFLTSAVSLNPNSVRVPPATSATPPQRTLHLTLSAAPHLLSSKELDRVLPSERGELIELVRALSRRAEEGNGGARGSDAEGGERAWTMEIQLPGSDVDEQGNGITGAIRESDRLETFLDLEDLTAAISEDAFSIHHPRHPSNSTRTPLPPRSLSSFLSGKESDDASSVFTSETDEEEGDRDEADAITVPGSIAIEPDRARVPSLTSRLFGSPPTTKRPPSISGSVRSTTSSIGSATSATAKRKAEGGSYADWMGWKSWSKGSKPREPVPPLPPPAAVPALEVVASEVLVNGLPAAKDDEDQSNNTLRSIDNTHDRSISTSTYFTTAGDDGPHEDEDWFTPMSGATPSSGALSSSTLSANSNFSRPETFSTNGTITTSNTTEPNDPSSTSPVLSDGPSSPISRKRTDPTNPTNSELEGPTPTNSTFTAGGTSPPASNSSPSISPILRSPRRAFTTSSLPSTASATLPRSTSRGALPALLSPTHQQVGSLSVLPPSLSTPVLPASTFTTSQELARPLTDTEDAEDGAGKRKSTHFQAVVWAADEWSLRPGGVGEREQVFWRYERVGGKVRSLVERLLGNMVVDRGRKPGLARESLKVLPPSLQVRTSPVMDEQGAEASPSGSSIVSLPKPKAGDGERSVPSSGFGSTISRALGLGLGGMHNPHLTRDPSPPAQGVRRTTEPNLTLFPKLSSLSKYSPFAQPALSTPSPRVSLSTTSSSLSVPTLTTTSNTTSTTPSTFPSTSTSTKSSIVSAPTTMELDTISSEPPPTLAPPPALPGGGDENAPLVDRYGFVYDVRSGMQLLREARKKEEDKAKKLAAQDDEEEVLEDDVTVNTDKGDAPNEALEERTLFIPPEAGPEVRPQTQEEIEEELTALREALGLPPSSTATSVAPSMSGSPAVPRSPITSTSRHDSPSGGALENVDEDGAATDSKDEQNQFLAPPAAVTFSTSASSSSSPPVAPSNSVDPTPTPTPSSVPASTLAPTLSPAPTGGPQSMKRLLSQLGEMHDAVEKVQKEAWDNFIRRRQAKLTKSHSSTLGSSGGMGTISTAGAASIAALMGENSTMAMGGEEEAGWSDNLVGIAQMGNVAGKSGKEDWEEFKKLVRKGIPISYRPKIWAECSGANEAREPGLYQELLSQHKGETNTCVNQIDMDCHRTFPTNVFFAGNGPGVAKLRNVLVAYSWRNPTIGYCQGMNNLAATLLLTHPSEEDAFWVLVCLIEKILPSDYFTSHLLVSQADQRILRDLVQRILPEVAVHLDELGVELPAITFGWFLSLFTDALPIQTLLRVWDHLFVFGMGTLFRSALAIIQMNQVEILACDSGPSLYMFMSTMTNHLYQADKLMKIACEDLRLVVKDREITSLRVKHAGDLRMELSLPPAMRHPRPAV